MVTDTHREAFRAKLASLLKLFLPHIDEQAQQLRVEARIGRSLDEIEAEAVRATLRDRTIPRWMSFETALKARAPQLAELLIRHPVTP